MELIFFVMYYTYWIWLLYTTHNEVVGGYIGFTPPVRPSVRPSVRLSVRPSHIPCPLCSAHSSGGIHFILIHLIKQLQKVCGVPSFLQNFKIWIFGNFLKFVTLTSSFLTWDLTWITSMGNHGAAGVSQNAGVLVVLVEFDVMLWTSVTHD